MAIWHPNSGISYSRFLQSSSFIDDIKREAGLVGSKIVSEVSIQTEAIVANSQQLSKEFGRGFDSVNNSLNWGFSRIESGLEQVSASISEIGADFNYNMGLILERISFQNSILAGLIDKLDEIHNTLKSPVLTQAREFYNMGANRLAKGLLDKALDAFLEAEKKNDSDFFTEFKIGQIYLYGIDEDDNVLDLGKAENHLLFAYRLAKAEITTDSRFKKFAAESLLHASIAIYAQLSEKPYTEDIELQKQRLLYARRLVLEATQLNPKLAEAFYHVAKYSSLLGDSGQTANFLKAATIEDRSYSVKADIDHAFDSMRTIVTDTMKELSTGKRTEVEQNSKICADQLLNMREWMFEESGISEVREEYQHLIEELLSARGHIDTNTYFGFTDAQKLLDTWPSRMEALKKRRIDELKAQIEEKKKKVNERLGNIKRHYSTVNNLIQDANHLLIKIKEQENSLEYESLKSAITFGELAVQKAREAADQEYKEALQEYEREVEKRRNQRRWRASLQYSIYGAGLGSLVGLLGGGGLVASIILCAASGFVIGRLHK